MPATDQPAKRFTTDLLYEKDVFARSAVLWIAFMVVMQVVFAIGFLSHPEAWNDVVPVARDTGWDVLLFIIGNNLLIVFFITIGNLFVRFGAVTPGLLILAYHAVAIGWIAGTNGFMEPFASLTEANLAFLRIGLWETTGYVLVCAVTLPKSLYIAESFPARQWEETRTLKDLHFSPAEFVVAASGLICLFGAAIIEAF